MSAAYPKFVFDTVFEPDGAMTAPARPRRSFTPEEVEAVRAAAFAEGERSAVAEAERRAADALAEAARAACGALETLAAVAHDHRTGSARLALAAARKIADAALDAFPLAPAEAAVAALAREIDSVPRLMVRAAPDQAERMQAALERAGAAAGYPGQIVVATDPDLPRAAFVFDWGDGRAAYDPDLTAARVGEALETALAAEGLHAEPLTVNTQGPSHG